MDEPRSGERSLIVAHDLVKQYPARDGQRLAVDGVSLTVQAGEVVAVLGPNGAGKSSLLRMIATQLEPDGGRLEVDGRPPTDATAVRRRVGLVAGDERSFFWRLTGRQNLRFFAALAGLDREEVERRIAEVGRDLELSQLLDRRVDRMSAGMKQRLGLARALVPRPSVVLLDEPTRSLDPLTAKTVGRTIRRLADAGAAVVLVTHDLDEAATVADRWTVMVDGRLHAAPSLEPIGAAAASSEPTDWARVVASLAPTTGGAELDRGDRPPEPPWRAWGACLLAFLRRDLAIHASYRAALLLELGGVVLSAATFYFVGQLLGDGNPHLVDYGGEYFPFVIIGLAFFGFQATALGSLSKTVREGQLTGTLEAMLATAAPLPAVLLGSTIWPLVQSGLRAGLYLGLGWAAFGLGLGGPDLAATAVLVGLLVSATIGAGLISASFVVVFKRGDPVQYAISALTTLVSGVYFPVSVLPEALRMVSDLLPLTFALEGFRQVLLGGAGLSELGRETLALSVFTVVLVPTGLAAFAASVRRARRSGSLSQY